MDADEEVLDLRFEPGKPQDRYVAPLSKGGEAIALVSRPKTELMIVHWVGVPPEYRGRGVARRFMGKIVDEARKGGFKLLPYCSYAAAVLRRSPEWHDVLSGAPTR